MPIIHKVLVGGRWYELTFLEQMANIGADVDRAIRWKNKGELEYSNGAFERALELLDFTMADPKNRGPRLKEVCRVREVFIDYFLYENQYNMTDEFWYNYFMDLSYLAAIERGR